MQFQTLVRAVTGGFQADARLDLTGLTFAPAISTKKHVSFASHVEVRSIPAPQVRSSSLESYLPEGMIFKKDKSYSFDEIEQNYKLIPKKEDREGTILEWDVVVGGHLQIVQNDVELIQYWKKYYNSLSTKLPSVIKDIDDKLEAAGPDSLMLPLERNMLTTKFDRYNQVLNDLPELRAAKIKEVVDDKLPLLRKSMDYVLTRYADDLRKTASTST